MNRTLYTCFLLLIMTCVPGMRGLLAADFSRPMGARGWGLANTTLTFSDIWASQNNQAGLGFLKKAEAGTYLENRFRLSNLNYGSVAAALPTKQGVFALSMSYFGYNIYSEQKFGLSYGRALGEKFSMGFMINYNLVAIREYGSKGTPSIEAGVIYKVNKTLQMGAHVRNPTMQKMDTKTGERLPTVAKLGLNYHPSDKLALLAETEKDLDRDAVFKAGAEYKVHEKLYLRTGLSNNPFMNTFGIGYNDGKHLRIDMAASIHTAIGVSPHVSLTWILGKK